MSKEKVYHGTIEYHQGGPVYDTRDIALADRAYQFLHPKSDLKAQRALTPSERDAISMGDAAAAHGCES